MFKSEEDPAGTTNADADADDANANTSSAATAADVVPKNKFLSEGPDLHAMGKIFLGRFGQILFDISVFVHFNSNNHKQSTHTNSFIYNPPACRVHFFSSSPSYY
eukprot:GEZU01011108.1.p2 GENE.GEZU01011108.1~~GEZU01011108.1.p2  ORF type:complete len:105 (-),score=30.78 GEZU01011108.1:38-352(-)